MKIDPYKHKEKYLKWKKESEEKGINDLSKYNSSIILQYLRDMENGFNVASSSKKGARSHIRLNTLRQKLRSLALKFQNIYNLNKITKISEERLCGLFSAMRKGEIRKQNGTIYQSTGDFVKIFKAFWHWWMKINRKQDKEIKDITLDLDMRTDKPRWVYLTEDQIKKLCNNCTFKYKVLIMFLFDTGIRAPTELMNVKVSDFYNDFKELNIREEVSKTFGRKIKLMICSPLIKEFIESEKLGQEDYLFQISPPSVNQYLKRLAKKILGNKESLAGQKYSELTMYDFRHCSCCYWLPRYKSESALKFRFGWKKSDKIHYYSEMLGMRDTITEDDMLLDITKTELENRLQKSEREKEIIQERMDSMEAQMEEKLKQIFKLVGTLENNIYQL
ncbi:MAG: hypothetical protein ACTSWK_16705 [Promethearchaeota archaeon]